MKVLALAASNSRQSINKALVTYAAKLLKDKIAPDADIEVLDLNDFEMPLYSIDRQNDVGILDLAHQFYQKIGDADALLISFAEHNGSYTAAYKNLFDWASRIDSKVFQDTPAVYLSTSPGPGGAGSVLAAAKNSAAFFGAVLKADLSVPKFHENFDQKNGYICNPEIQAQLETALGTLR